ncbi:hypothetical protein [Methylobacterium oryzisoli]|uniref:hypothetical protein n=1 Tax=Methylobacterium oryzisoli TaxID=3385502 RepID=UPI0038920857
MSVIGTIYNNIDKVLGGSDDNQLFTMVLPGTLLNRADFSQGASTEILRRSSNLADALLDVCQVAAGPNGRKLSSQYDVALNSLLPALNPTLEALRQKLRDALKQTIDMDRPDGSKATVNKLEWFNVLIEKYNDEISAWDKSLNAERDSIAARFPDPSDQPKREDAFNTWYSDAWPEAERRIQQAHLHTSELFSPNEMALIESVLDVGDDILTEARANLSGARRRYPSGDAYPVDFTPSDWADLLVSAFDYVDLLKSPEAIALQIDNAQKMLDTATENLNIIGADMPQDIQGDLDKLNTARSDYQSKQDALLSTFTDNAATAAKIYLSKHNQNDSTKVADINALTKKLNDGQGAKSVDDKKKGGSPLTPADVDQLVNGQKALIAAQSAVQASGLALADASLKYMGDQAQYVDLKPEYEKLKTAATEIAGLQRQLAAASSVPDTTVEKLFSDTASDRFSQVSLTFKSDDMKKDSTLNTSFEQTNWSVDLFFGSASGEKTTSSSDFHSSLLTASADLEMGFLVAKVAVDRPWFDPGVLSRTVDMHSIATSRISPGILTPAAFKSAAGTILPTYPTAFVIAKDITIKITLNSGQTNQARSLLDKHESEGGGIFCFSVSHVSAEHHDTQSFSSHVEGTSVIIRIPAPQIIGWYQEFLPEDRSTPLKDDDGEFSRFLGSYKALTAPASDRLRVVQAA